MFAEALGAKLAPVYRMAGITANRNCLVILYADQHAAADRAVTAGSFDLALGDAGTGDVAGYRIALKGVIGLPGVDPECAPKTGPHQCVPPRVKVSAMFSGTTETKKRYRARSTATKAAAQASAEFE